MFDYIMLYDIIREMGGAPRNAAPRNHFLVWIVKPSGFHCTDGHLTSRVFTEDQNIAQCRLPLGTLPLSPISGFREPLLELVIVTVTSILII